MNTTRTALITGAGSGIGAEVAQRLAQQGYHLIISGSNRHKLERLAEKLPVQPSIEVADLSQSQQVAELCDRLRDYYPPLDIAFINAGIVEPGPFAERERASIDREIDINFRSALHLIQACIPGMKRQRSGHIIATSSIGGILALGDSSVYCATKFALRGFLSGLRQELSVDGIKVCGLYPGAIDTPMLRFEAENGGSPLNFLHPPASTADVAEAFMKALKTGRLETYVPYRDSITARILSLFPGAIVKLLPRFVKTGEAGRLQYIKSWSSSKESKQSQCPSNSGELVQ
jgi:short-subunit dehydrogenase